MTEPPMIEVRDLYKTYRGGLMGRGFEALCGLTLDVGCREIFGLLGPNGAGKTTLVKVLLGIVHTTRGTARMLGYPAGDRRSRRQVGYLPEQLRIARHHTARTAMKYYGQLSGMTSREIRKRSSELLELVGLQGRDRESVKRFSKGMLQRLGIAQALMHNPQLIFLDEPTDGLDPVGRTHVRYLLQQLRDEGRTVFVNSHLLQEIELVCDRVAVLDHGHLRYVGTIRDLTPPEEPQVTFSCHGGPDAIMTALLPMVGQVELQRAGQRWQFKIIVKDQGNVDAVVDALRAARISVATIEEHRLTLEDAFLKLVSRTGVDS